MTVPENTHAVFIYDTLPALILSESARGTGTVGTDLPGSKRGKRSCRFSKAEARKTRRGRGGWFLVGLPKKEDQVGSADSAMSCVGVSIEVVFWSVGLACLTSFQC